MVTTVLTFQADAMASPTASPISLTIAVRGDVTSTVIGASTIALTVVPAAVDLALKMAHAGNFTVGTNGVYTLTVTNVGTIPTTGTITVTDTLPSGLGFVSGTGTGWSCSANAAVVTCTNAGPLAAGGISTITLTVSVAAAAVPSVTNSAGVATAGDSISSNDSASDPTVVNPLGTAPAITSQNGATFAEGAAASFTVTTTGSPVPSLTETGALPAGVMFTDNGDGTASLTGTPAAGTAANSPYAITIRAANGITPDAQQSFTLTITGAPLNYSQGPILDIGNSFALDDAVDTIVLGDSSAVLVFVNTAGSWSLAATLSLPNGRVAALGISGDGHTVVAGAQGQAYVYVEPSGGWANTGSPDAVLTASDGAAIGTAVAVDEAGQTVAVGTPHGTTAGCGTCAVYVYVMPSGGWIAAMPPTMSTEAVKLTDPTHSGTNLSISLSIDAAGDTIVAGEASDNASLGVPDFAQIYTKPAAGWSASTGAPTATLTASDQHLGDNFGFSVSISRDGTAIAVGAPDHGVGAAYVFLKPSSGLWMTTSNQDAELAASDASPNEAFGFSISISDGASTVAVGEPFHPITALPPTPRPGAAYQFKKPVTGWTNSQIMNQTQELAPAAGMDYAGRSVTPISSFGFTVVASRNAGTIVISGAATVGGTGGFVVYLFQ